MLPLSVKMETSAEEAGGLLILTSVELVSSETLPSAGQKPSVTCFSDRASVGFNHLSAAKAPLVATLMYCSQTLH